MRGAATASMLLYVCHLRPVNDYELGTDPDADVNPIGLAPTSTNGDANQG